MASEQVLQPNPTVQISADAFNLGAKPRRRKTQKLANENNIARRRSCHAGLSECAQLCRDPRDLYVVAVAAVVVVVVAVVVVVVVVVVVISLYQCINL